MYVDDILLINKLKQKVKARKKEWFNTLERRRIRISSSRMKYMVMTYQIWSRNKELRCMSVIELFFNNVSSFTYLKSTGAADENENVGVIMKMLACWKTDVICQESQVMTEY